MQTRNLVLFFALSLGMLIAWNNYVVPRFFPHKPVQNAANDAAKKDAAALAQVGKTGAAHDKEAAKAAAGKDQPGDKAGDKKPDTSVVKAGDKPAANDAAKDAGKDAAKKGADQAVAKDAAPKGAAAKAGEPAVPKFPQQTIVLGSGDPDTGYFLKAELTTKGGSVAGIEFNDPRYRELSNTEVPLKIVGNSLDQRTIKAIKDRDLAQAEHEMAAERLRALQSTLKPGEASAEIDGVRTALRGGRRKTQAGRPQRLAGNDHLQHRFSGVRRALAQGRKRTVGPQLESRPGHRRPEPSRREFGRHVSVSLARRHAGFGKAIFARIDPRRRRLDAGRPRSPRHEHRRLPPALRRRVDQRRPGRTHALIHAAGTRRPAAGRRGQRAEVPRSQDGFSAQHRSSQRPDQDDRPDRQ